MKFFGYCLKYVDWISQRLDKSGKAISAKLYRRHAVVSDDLFLKDLARIGRDLAKIIIVDNKPENF